MLYQRPLSSSEAFVAQIADIGEFQIHRHYEIEMLLCIENGIEVLLPDETVTLGCGELIFIGSFIPHGYSSGVSARAVLIELGPMFLKDSFTLFSQLSAKYRLYRDENDEVLLQSRELLDILSDDKKYSRLDIIGSLYKLSAAVIRQEETISDAPVRFGKRGIDDISPALHLIHMSYTTALTVPDAAAACNLSKGNFCTLFKSVVGMSFHAYLNSYRIQNAGFLLRQTEMSVEEIAATTGFSDVKTFYRVFRRITGMSPGQYKLN